MHRTYYAACPPAVRLLLIDAWTTDCDETTDYRVYPVVALRFFHDPVDGDDKNGVGIDVVVVDSFDLELTTPTGLETEISHSLLVAAPWDPSEDPERLIPFVAEAKKRAMRKSRRPRS